MRREDLPEPDGPTSATAPPLSGSSRRSRRIRSSSSSTTPCLPKNNSASLSRSGSSPRYGALLLAARPSETLLARLSASSHSSWWASSVTPHSVSNWRYRLSWRKFGRCRPAK